MNRECRNCAHVTLAGREQIGNPHVGKCGGWESHPEFPVEIDGACARWRAYTEPRGGIREGEAMTASVPWSWLARIEALEKTHPHNIESAPKRETCWNCKGDGDLRHGGYFSPYPKCGVCGGRGTLPFVDDLAALARRVGETEERRSRLEHRVAMIEIKHGYAR